MKTLFHSILLLELLLVIPNKSFASSISEDSTPQAKPWKISQQQFLDRYGKDDTSRGIISYFFKRRKTGQIICIAGAIITTGLGFSFDKVIINNPNIGLLLILLIVPMFSIVISGFGISTLLGVYLWVRYSRKRLWKILSKYFSGEGIPKKLKLHSWKGKK